MSIIYPWLKEWIIKLFLKVNRADVAKGNLLFSYEGHRKKKHELVHKLVKKSGSRTVILLEDKIYSFKEEKQCKMQDTNWMFQSQAIQKFQYLENINK